MNAIMIDDRDNAVVVTEPILKGQIISYTRQDGTVCTLLSRQDIAIYHKAAIKDILAGTPIIKYGEHIGLASSDIKAGMHIHEHNVLSVREILNGGDQ